MQTWGILQFPGSNSDLDAFRVFERLPGIKPVMHWHEDEIPTGQYQILIIPGGFSFGDYLRAGAIAKLSRSIASLPEAVEKGCHVMGICNGFQILLESGCLPGVLQVNKELKFISRKVDCEIKAAAAPWFNESDVGNTIRLPIAHGFGNYQFKDIDRSEIKPVLVYSENPNGSKDSIAGVYRQQGSGSYFGLMPHPERNALEFLPRRDGASLWETASKVLAA